MITSRLDYFAANAPEAPDWYRDKKQSENIFDFQKYFNSILPALNIGLPDSVIEQAKGKTLDAANEHELKIKIEIYFSWRKYYAEQMVEMLGCES